MDNFDLVVIGSGPGGYRAAVLGALRGLQVAVVERAQWGGCCLNRGCVPKKDWYHTARLLAAQDRFARRGITGALRPDFMAAWQHQEQVVEKVQASYLDYLKRLGVARYEGTAAFDAPRRLRVQGNGQEHVLEARRIIIATGSRPEVPEPLRHLPRSRVLTTDDLFDAPPPSGDRVAILGAGVIATEFAFILTLLGKQVFWLARSEPLSRTRFSAQARAALKKALAGHHIEPVRNQVLSVRAEGQSLLLDLADGRSEVCDWLLAATGRRPVTDALLPERGGVELDPDGFVTVNEGLQTTAAGVYAIGDCIRGVMTANQALHDASAVIASIVSEEMVRRAPEHVPEVIYSALELARIGLDEDQAEDAGFEPAVGFAAFETSPQALGQDDPEGFVRLLGDMDSGHLLGGEIVGAEAGELIHTLALSTGDAALRNIARGSFNHPSRAEEVLNATETLAHKWGLAEAVFGDGA